MSANICDCPTSKYWSGSTCVDRVGNGGSCTTGHDYNCYFESGLSCINSQCIDACPNANTYWDVSSCRTYQTYNQPCSSYKCNPSYGLICSSSNACQCPTSMSGSYCDCSSTQYWNGNQCVERSTFGGSCLQDYNCYNGKNLFCNGVICDCVSADYFWAADLNSCSINF